MQTQANQFILMGDPAVSLFPADRAEYEVTDGSLSIQAITLGKITALSDSFKILCMEGFDAFIFNISLLRKF